MVDLFGPIWYMEWLRFRGLFRGCYWCKRMNPTGIKLCLDFCAVGPLVVGVLEMLGWGASGGAHETKMVVCW